MFSNVEIFGFAPTLAFRRWLVRRTFDKARRVVYEGILGIEGNSAATRKPTWAEVFGGWAKRTQIRNKGLSQIYRDIQKRLQSGASLSRALEPYIPLEDYMVIDAGEASNRLQSTFESLLKNFEASKEIQSAVRGAYMSPLGAMAGFVFVSIYSGLWLWPGLLSAIPEKYWPSWALVMVNFQVFLASNLSLLLVFAVLFLAYRWSLSRWTGKWRGVADRWLPFYGAYRDNIAAMLLIVLSGLLRAGKTIDQAMQHIGMKSGSRYMRWHTRTMQRRVVLFAGDPGRMLNTGLINDEILDRIHNAASTRKLSDSLQYIGGEAIDGVVKSVKTSAIIGATALYMVFAGLMFYYAATLAIGNVQASDNMARATKANF
jgi:type II secretory pathway component PulF